MDDWKDKSVLVTGGSSGLGRAIAETFHAAGSRVAVVGLEPELVQQAARQIGSPDTAMGLVANVTMDDQVGDAVDATVDRFGGLDVLVNCAGRSMRGSLRRTTPEQFRSLIELNLLGTVRCTQAALPHLVAARGHVVNIGSLAAKSAARWVGAYPASKHAVAAYSQQLRLELGPEGLHVLLVCPGPIRRDEERLYPLEGLEDLPDDARRPGGGVRVGKIDPHWLAHKILKACQHRRAELVVPWKARLLFAVSALFPSLGDRLVRMNT